jgi:hypothetical protein
MTPRRTIRRITTIEFDAIAAAAVEAVSWVEGWCDEHPTLRPLGKTDGRAEPSTRFKAQLRRELLERGIKVVRHAV